MGVPARSHGNRATRLSAPRGWAAERRKAAACANPSFPTPAAAKATGSRPPHAVSGSVFPAPSEPSHPHVTRAATPMSPEHALLPELCTFMPGLASQTGVSDVFCTGQRVNALSFGAKEQN